MNPTGCHIVGHGLVICCCLWEWAGGYGTITIISHLKCRYPKRRVQGDGTEGLAVMAEVVVNKWSRGVRTRPDTYQLHFNNSGIKFCLSGLHFQRLWKNKTSSRPQCEIITKQKLYVTKLLLLFAHTRRVRNRFYYFLHTANTQRCRWNSKTVPAGQCISTGTPPIESHFRYTERSRSEAQEMPMWEWVHSKTGFGVVVVLVCRWWCPNSEEALHTAIHMARDIKITEKTDLTN